MNKYIEIEQRAIKLLRDRGIYGHVAADRFVNDFVAYLIKFDALEAGNAEDTLTLLEDDNNLTDGNILKTNFRKNIFDLVSPVLRKDPIFWLLFPVLLLNKGKGVGVGELVLPLILSGYRFSNTSDGILYENWKSEIKNNGASLKPVASGITVKGLVDKLNAKYFNGTVPGMKDRKKFNAHLATIKDPSVYRAYFEELYVSCDVTSLVEEVTHCYQNADLFNEAVGKFALREYQKVDGWNNIMYIDCDSMQIVNIADVSNIDGLGLSFSPKLARKKDTQAISDGYVNVKI